MEPSVIACESETNTILLANGFDYDIDTQGGRSWGSLKSGRGNDPDISR